MPKLTTPRTITGEHFFINYDGQPLVEAIITDRSKADTVIKDMVDFWSGGEDRLHHAKGDYTKAWLTQLALFCLEQRRPPSKGEDEGWVPLDGTYGIIVQDYYHFDFDEDQIEIS